MDWVTPNKKATVDAPPCKPADSTGVSRPKALPRLRRLKNVAAYGEVYLAIREPVRALCRIWYSTGARTTNMAWKGD